MSVGFHIGAARGILAVAMTTLNLGVLFGKDTANQGRWPSPIPLILAMVR